MAGNLYQLHCKGELQPGAYVAVNGPHDTYGFVIQKIRFDEKKQANLYLIRGCERRDGHKPVCQF